MLNNLKGGKVLRSRLALGAVAAAMLTTALLAGGASPARAATNSGFTVVIGSQLTLSDGTPQVLDDADNNQVPGAGVVDYPEHYGMNQKWTFFLQGVAEVGNETESVFEIDNANSLGCLTTDGVAGDQVTQTPCNGNPDQLWRSGSLSPQTLGSTGTLQSVSSGLYLDIYNASHDANTIIDTWPYNGNANQMFVAGEAFAEQANTQFTAAIKVSDANNSGLVLDVIGASTTTGADIVEASANGQPSQQWTFVPFGSFNYEIKNVNSGLCITTSGDVEAAVEQQPCLGNTDQMWHTALNPSDTNPLGSTAETIQAVYSADPSLAGFYLQADVNGPAAGTVVGTYYRGTGDQSFTLA